MVKAGSKGVLVMIRFSSDKRVPYYQPYTRCFCDPLCSFWQREANAGGGDIDPVSHSGTPGVTCSTHGTRSKPDPAKCWSKVKILVIPCSRINTMLYLYAV